jgi:hypothetical protein
VEPVATITPAFLKRPGRYIVTSYIYNIYYISTQVIREPIATSNEREGRLMPNHVLVRMAMTGIYLLHGIPREVQQAARTRAIREETTLRLVLLQALNEYAAGAWPSRKNEPRPTFDVKTHRSNRG